MGKGIPSIATIMATISALNETGMMDIMADAFGPDKNIVEAFAAADLDPWSLIDAMIPFIMIRMLRKFTGPVSAGPVRFI